MQKTVLRRKQSEFTKAMHLYHDKKRYKYLQKFISILVISSQVFLFVQMSGFSLSVWWHIGLFLLAYFITDLVNGLGHMYMDNSDNYNSLIGPYIAAFHLHHRTPQYAKQSIFALYYNEAGTKLWLLLFYPFSIVFVLFSSNEYFGVLLIYIGFLSCFAELSHYLCHNSRNKYIRILQDLGILLSIKKHQRHHKENNRQYAFLNGMSDFIIDFISAKLYTGYQVTTDLHYSEYQYKESQNRL